MSLSNLRVPNNKFQDCPAQMEDGRYITDYRPNVMINTQLEKTEWNRTYDNYEYRQFLIHNGNKIMEANMDVLQKINNCPCSLTN